MVVKMFRVFLCGLTGHSDLLQVGDHGLRLRCSTCGRTTPGFQWEHETRRSDGIRSRAVNA